jgi:hypothetical protein
MTVTRVQGTTQNVSTGTGTATATCPGGSWLIGGGGTANGTSGGETFAANVVGSWPSTPGQGGTWSYRATRASAIERGGPFAVTAYAVCAA